MDHPVVMMLLLWAAGVVGLQAAERSALMPNPRLAVQGLVIAVALVGLYLMMRRVA